MTDNKSATAEENLAEESYQKWNKRGIKFENISNLIRLRDDAIDRYIEFIQFEPDQEDYIAFYKSMINNADELLMKSINPTKQ